LDARKVARPQWQRGCRVGFFYALACGVATWGGEPELPVSIKRLRGRITAQVRRRVHPANNVGEKLLERDLRDFRSVGMLWAAYWCSKFDRLDVFHADRLAEFLALSEWIRSLALTTRTRKGDPLLSADTDLWRPPACLCLPMITPALKKP
jgi:hypothetical protein